MATTFTETEKKILKRFVGELKKAGKEAKKGNRVRRISLSRIFKKALEED